MLPQDSVPSVLAGYADDIKKSMNQLSPSAFQDIHTYELDCSSLADYSNESIEAARVSKIIKDIEYYNGHPAVYWFEIVSEHNPLEVYNSTLELSTKLVRKLPAFKKKLTSETSNVLYVGKVDKNLAGRMMIHLGYYEREQIQGLQLCHWPNKVGFKLNLKVIYLPKDLYMLAGVFEKELARHLKPILGTHK